MKKHYHLIGIGGIGMSGIAQLLLCKGIKVSGSDLKESRITRDLRKSGAEIFIGHDPGNVRGSDAVVYSSAIKEDNPEFAAALKSRIPLFKRAQALAELMQEKTVITVTGSHGKTTTTSLVSCLLMEAGLNPTVAIGGILKNIDTNACLGEGDYFVAEADESDGSFLYYRPRYSVITNIDIEHLDYYKSFDNELEAFRKFLSATEDSGCVFCCSDDPNLLRLVKDCGKRNVTFGLKKGADIYADNIKFRGLTSRFDCYRRSEFLADFDLALGGEHNISNALSVIALGLELGIDLAHIKKALLEYKGAGRRLEVKFSDDDFLLIDDYAHHPTEIKATLSAVRNLAPERLVAIFQPHRYSRTQLLLEEFGKSFDSADCVVITDIYPASEKPIDGVTGYSVYEELKKNSFNKEIYFMKKDELSGGVLKIIRPKDVVIALGAGDITRVSDELAQNLKIKSQAE